MADTSTFMAIGSVPQVDYGAVYRNAKARRELEEEKKLAYLNQFQQERGSFTPGLQDQLQMEWDAIEADLDAGDMSFEAKARRQKLYNQYKQHAADALTYAQTINDLEASILADPSQYNDPAAIMQQLEQARTIPVDVNMIGNATSQLPRLGEFRRFALPEISPNAAAGMILQNLKTSGGYQDFYDMDEGALSPEAVANSVGAWFGANSLSQEEEDQAIAYVLHQLGGLSGNMEDLSKIRNLDDSKREEYIGMYAQYVTNSLSNMLAKDIETQKEQDRRELDLYRSKTRIQRREAEAAAAAAATPKIFSVQDSRMHGGMSYAPFIEADPESGQFIKAGEPDLVNPGYSVYAKIDGTAPYYLDERGEKKYIDAIGIDGLGQQYAVVRSSQDVIQDNESTKHVGRESVPISDIPLNALSNVNQAKKIQETFNVMLPYWSQNFAGRTQGPGQPGPGADGLTQSANWLMNAEVDVNSPEYRKFVDEQIDAEIRAESPAPKSPAELNALKATYPSMSDREKIDYFVDIAIGNGALQGGYAQYEKMTPEEKGELAIRGMKELFLAEPEFAESNLLLTRDIRKHFRDRGALEQNKGLKPFNYM